MSYWRDLGRALLGETDNASRVSRRDTGNAKGSSRGMYGGWDVSSSGRRFMNWVARRDGMNSLIFAEAERVRDRARDAGRQNPWAAAAIESMTANVIGTGIKPQSRHPSKAVRENLMKLWNYWVLNCDADGRTDFYGLQALAFRGMVESGETLGRTRYRRSYDQLIIPMLYQLLEPDFLDFNKNGVNGDNDNTIQAGIEFDKLGQRVAYHLYTTHPNETTPGNRSRETVRVKAEQVDHLYKVVRPGQLRGVSWLGPALAKLYDVNGYDDSELLRKKFSAMFVGFITENDENDPIVPTVAAEDSASLDVRPTVGDDQNGDLPTRPGTTDVDWAEMQAGTMVKLNPNEQISFSKPEDVGGMYAEFMKMQLHAISTAIGAMYEMVTGDMSEASYSSVRTNVLEFRRKAEQWQFGIVCYQLCQPVWERFIRSCALQGLIDAGDFSKNPMDYLFVDWRTPVWAWVDPEKDIKAEIAAIRAGLKARSTSIAERGEDAEAVDAQTAADNQRTDAAGVIYDSDPRNRDQAGKALVAPAAGAPEGDAGGAAASAAPQAPKTKGKELVQ